MTFPDAITPFAGNSGANVTSQAVAHGGSVGDLVIVIFENDGTSTATGSTGWTQRGSLTQGAAMRGSVYHRILDGGANDSLTVTIGASQGCAWAGVVVKAGTFDPVEMVAIQINAVQATTSTPDPANLDPATWGTEDTLWIAGLAWDGNISIVSYPSDMPDDQTDSRWASSDGGGASVCTVQSHAASFDPNGWTLSGGSSTVAYCIAVRPTSPEAPTTFRSGQSDVID